MHSLNATYFLHCTAYVQNSQPERYEISVSALPILKKLVYNKQDTRKGGVFVERIKLPGGIDFYSFRDARFKQGALSIQFVRPMKKEEIALNALLPAVLLRGTTDCPDLRTIILRLDDLYGASVSALVRRVGDYQTTGLYCNFMEDRFALDGDAILAPMLEFVGQLLLDPVLENGVFSRDFVESEKKNLIATIESEINDKRVYASAQLMKLMCKNDSFGLPRLGDKEDVQPITAQALYDHYQKVLSESPVQVFYVGNAEPETVAGLLTEQFAKIRRAPISLPPQTGFCDSEGCHKTESMDVSLTRTINSLPKDGRIVLTACGRMISFIASL